ncbi:hypothetical protein D5278_19225 [bacterium 1XD21-13]|nr:hypothetical protein [bacterium 1XD21-13]
MSGDIMIRHTASAGVLITIGGSCVGADVFSRDPAGLYPDTPADVRAELLKEIGRGGIETLLFTHGHGDHFCLEDTVEALRRNPSLEIISTETVIGQLQKAAPGCGKLKSVSPAEKGNVMLHLPVGTLEIFNSRHMGEAYAGVQNLTCMLEIHGKRLVLLGDAWPEAELFAKIGAWASTPDVLIVPFPVIGLPSSRRLLAKYLKPAHILALHLPRPERDEQGWLASAKEVCERARDGLPLPCFGERLGQVYYL